MENNQSPKFPFFPTKREEDETTPFLELEERKVIIRKVEQLADVPKFVLENKSYYNFHTEVLKGDTVITSDRQKGMLQPNFKDESVIQTMTSEVEKNYGPWGEVQEGIAPIELINQQAAKQIEDKVEVFKQKKTLPDNAFRVKKRVVAPFGDETVDIHVSSLDLLREEEKNIAKEFHIATPVHLGHSGDIKKGYPSDQEIPQIAVKSKKSRMIPLDKPCEKEKVTKNLSIIKGKEARRYAKANAYANKERPRIDKPKQTDNPQELVKGEKTVFTPVGKGAQDYQKIANTLEEFRQKLFQNGYKKEEVEKILVVAMPQIFFLPSSKTKGDKAIVLWEEDEIEEKLFERKYSPNEVEKIKSVATVIHEEVVYNKPQVKNWQNFMGEAANVIELASKLKEHASMEEKQITQIIRYAKKVSNEPSLYAWSQRKELTYAWHETNGFSWGSKKEETYSWYEPLYPYGIEYEYLWSVAHDYSFAYVYDYERHIPQYQVRKVEPKMFDVRHEMYSYRYDKVLYCWEEFYSGDLEGEVD